MKLVSLANHPGGRTGVTHDQLRKYRKGLVCSSAGIDGEIDEAFIRGGKEGASAVAAWYKDTFGDDYRLEVTWHIRNDAKLSLLDNAKSYSMTQTSRFIKELNLNKALFAIGYELGIPVILTNDVHFVRKEDALAQDVLSCIRNGKKLADADRRRLSHLEYLRSETEMRELFPDHPEIIDNTLKVLSKIGDIGFFASGISVPSISTDPLRDLRDAAHKGAILRYGHNTRPLDARIEDEISSLAKVGFLDYPLILKEIVDWCRTNSVPVGPGRGSAAGSLLLYCLAVTEIDPIRYGLLSERFLNPERMQLPDVDLDFGDPDAVLRHLQDRYGKDHIARVMTYRVINATQAIRLSARVLGYPVAKTESLLRLIPRNGIIVTEDADYTATISNCILHDEKMKAKYENGDFHLQEVLDSAARLEGHVIQRGTHACSVVLAPGPVDDFVPVRSTTGSDGQPVRTTQYGALDVEDAGLLKLDLLGLVPLSIIQSAGEMVKEDLDMDMAVDDTDTLSLFSEGDTIGVFEFEDDWMRDILKGLGEIRFSDICALLALYRSPSNALLVEFQMRKCGEIKHTFAIKEANDILDETYGVLVYQEQLMLLAQRIAGFTPGQSDRLRKAFSKGNLTVMNEMRDVFVEGGIRRGHTEADLQEVWDLIYRSGGCAYPKAHCVSYAMIAMREAYLKAHHPEAFFESALNCYYEHGLSTDALIEDCNAHGLKVTRP